VTPLDHVYRERARVVGLLAALFPSCYQPDPDDHDFRIVYVATPAGQLSWHIKSTDWDLIGNVLRAHDGLEVWDGHSTDVKNIRMNELTDMIVRGEIGPARPESFDELLAASSVGTPVVQAAADMYAPDVLFLHDHDRQGIIVALVEMDGTIVASTFWDLMDAHHGVNTITHEIEKLADCQELHP